MLDLPILSDADDDAGFYVAAKGASTPWPGAVFYSSPDDVTYTEEVPITRSSVIGTTSDALSPWRGARVWDELSSVTVDVGAGTLSSSTRAAMHADQWINLAAVGQEIIRYRTATLQAVGIYKLTGLLRGERGSEYAMTSHAAGETFVKLTSGMARVEMNNTLIGVSRYYKGVTIGLTLTDATAQAFTNRARGLYPFSPVNGRVARDPATGDITLTWLRRSRLTCRIIGATGISIPLGESSESYQIDVMNQPSGSPDSVVKRTLTATSATVAYTATQQTTDFGATQSSVTFRIYQISAVIGRGINLEVTG